MFGFLKKKLQDAVSIFSKKAEVEAEDVVEKPVEEVKEQAPKAEVIEKSDREKNNAKKEEKSAKKEPVEKKEEKSVKKVSQEQSSKKEEEKKVQEKKTQGKNPDKNISVIQEKKSEEPSKKTPEITKQKNANATVVPTPEKEEPITADEKHSEAAIEITEPVKQEEKKGFFGKLKDRFVKKEESVPDAQTVVEKEEIESEETAPKEPSLIQREQISPKKEVTQIIKEDALIIEEESKGFFGKIGDAFTKKKISNEKFEELFWEIEVAMLEGNVAIEVIEKIKSDLKTDLVEKKVNRFDLQKVILASLRSSLKTILTQNPVDILEKIQKKSEKPFVICFVGINGAGKTTTIGKFIRFLQENQKTCVVAAADTFRAAALEQLQTHTDALKVKLIRHEYGSDAAAVAYDALQYAKQKGLDCVLVDTAGRLHSNTNLMGELQKVIRVSKADFVMFVGDALTGNDAVEQAQKYNELIGVDGIILAKADVDEKGGATISTSYVIQKPVMFLGVGQRYEDFEQFDAEKILAKLGL